MKSTDGPSVTAWVTGKAFANAFIELVGRGHQPGTVGVRVIPGVVCGAFAVELFLKSLLLADGRAIKGHHPSRLFDRLNPEVRARLRPYYPQTSSDEELRDLLTGLDHAFTRWRYAHEVESLQLDLGLLLVTVHALESVILDLHPDRQVR